MEESRFKIKDCLPHECPDCEQKCYCCDRMCSHPDTAECGVSQNWEELSDYR